MGIVLEFLQIAGIVFFVLIIIALAARASLRSRAGSRSGKNAKTGNDEPTGDRGKR